MVRRNLHNDDTYGDPFSGLFSPRGSNHGRRNAIYDTDMERDGGNSAFERARGDYYDPQAEESSRAMYNNNRRESRGGSAARARGGGRRGRGGYGGRGGAHGGAHEDPYHGVGAYSTDEEDNDPEHAPPGVTRFHRRRGEGMRRDEAHLGSRRGYGGGSRGGRIDPRDGSFHAPDACFSRDGTTLSRGGMMNRSHHHRGYDERAGQGLDDNDDDDDFGFVFSEEEGDSEDERLQAYYAGQERAEARRAAADHDRYGGPSRRY